MSSTSQFIATVYLLVKAGKWNELTEFFQLVREILAQPSVKITVGTPTDKPK